MGKKSERLAFPHIPATISEGLEYLSSHLFIISNSKSLTSSTVKLKKPLCFLISQSDCIYEMTRRVNETALCAVNSVDTGHHNGLRIFATKC